MAALTELPFHEVNAQGVTQPETQETFLVRTSGSNPFALATLLRKAIPQARAGFRVSDLRTQSDLVRAQTVRERLLAMLAAFFSFPDLKFRPIGSREIERWDHGGCGSLRNL
jgi:putative ABC transport system permease protein